ncbi:hypothetical protein RCL1_000998 [Eukaryota sp. TZLM3-RCL]
MKAWAILLISCLLISQSFATTIRTNQGLVNHAFQALNEKWGYVFSLFGEVLTMPRLIYLRDSHPTESVRRNIRDNFDFIVNNWMGRRVADCSGLLKSYLWWVCNSSGKCDPKYESATDQNETMMFNDAIEKGAISTIPDLPGVCVRLPGHIGYYVGNGTVIESRGTRYGVVLTQLKERPWTHWFKHRHIKYNTFAEVVKKLTPLVKNVDYLYVNAAKGRSVSGDHVRSLIFNAGKRLESSCTSYERAVDVLYKHNVVISPDYWKQISDLSKVAGENVRSLAHSLFYVL